LSNAIGFLESLKDTISVRLLDGICVLNLLFLWFKGTRPRSWCRICLGDGDRSKHVVCRGSAEHS
jgi:hypothetical protein